MILRKNAGEAGGFSQKGPRFFRESVVYWEKRIRKGRAILLTEYAGKRRSEGMTLAQAAYSAAKVRLRPILMTVLSMVFGLVPLMMAHGVGANGSRSLATGVIGGMIVGTLALLFLVPSLFITFQYIQERIKRN